MENITKRVIVLDTTLRDGEQAPGAAMTNAQKINIALALEALQVDIIEAGFAASSDYDLKGIVEITKQIKKTTISSLSRCIDSDILASIEALKNAYAPRIHLFISTSDILLKHQLHMSKADVLNCIKHSVGLAKKYIEDIQWGAMDATRSELDFLLKAIETAINAGAKTINIADTVGYTVPEEFSFLIQEIKNRVPNIDKAILSVHCHDDLGLATANTLAALNAGAIQFEGTINGIGERAGNAALEEVVMAIITRNDFYPFKTNIKPEHFATISALVEKASGFIVPNNKAILGRNAYSHASGIHQDGILKHPNTFQILDYKQFGFNLNPIILSRHSGHMGLKYRLHQLNIVLNDSDFIQLFNEFKKLAQTKKLISNQDLLNLVEQLKL